MSTMIRLAFRNIKENKKWAFMTVMGISVSLMLITMVISFAAGTYDSLSRDLLSRSDSWNEKVIYHHDKIDDVSTLVKNLEQREGISKYWIQSVLGTITNEREELIDIDLVEFQEGYDYSGIPVRFSIPTITEGRLAKNKNEIALSRNFNKDLKIGDFIEMTTINGEQMMMEVVGFMNQYQAQVSSYDHESDIYVYIEYKDGVKLSDEIALNASYDGYYDNELNTIINSLRGLSRPTNKMFWTAVSLVGFIVIIIALSSISLIYNAFYLSLEQKVQQIGVLKSVGATNKQIGFMVYFEGILLTLISITVGIVGGFFIAQQSLVYIGKTFSTIAGELYFFKPLLNINVIIAIYFIGILTVILPIKKSVKYANRISPVEIIRNISKNEDTLKYKKTPQFIEKLFGTSGNLAFKNYNRDRKKHRSTAISLVIVIVLLISISSFIKSGKELMRTFETGDFDISFSYYKSNPEDDEMYYDALKRAKEELKDAKFTTYTIFDIQGVTESLAFPLVDKYKDDFIYIPQNIVIYQDEDFAEYFGAENLRQNYFIPKLKGEQITYIDDVPEELYINEVVVDVKAGESYTLKFNEPNEKVPDPETLSLSIDKIIDDVPFTFSYKQNSNGVKYLMSETRARELGIYDLLSGEIRFYFEINTLVEVEDHEMGEKEILAILSEDQYPENFKYWVYNKTKDNLMITSIFGTFDIASFIVTGFIFVICVSNLLNVTTSTSRQRLQEYGVYRSVGMELKKLRKMLIIESFITSIKPLVIGILLGVISSYAMFNIVSSTMRLEKYSIDTNAIIYAIILVVGVQLVQLVSSVFLLKRSNIVSDLKRMEM